MAGGIFLLFFSSPWHVHLRKRWGVLWEEGREPQGVLRAEFLGMMAQGLCSSEVWEPGAHVEKKKVTGKECWFVVMI